MLVLILTQENGMVILFQKHSWGKMKTITTTDPQVECQTTQQMHTSLSPKGTQGSAKKRSIMAL